MRLDAMLGKTSIGIEEKIQGPTLFEARRNASSFAASSNGMLQRGRRPYPIPATELINSNQRRFDGMYEEDVKVTYYSNPRIFSHRTERDETMEMGVLYREIEDD